MRDSILFMRFLRFDADFRIVFFHGYVTRLKKLDQIWKAIPSLKKDFFLIWRTFPDYCLMSSQTIFIFICIMRKYFPPNCAPAPVHGALLWISLCEEAASPRHSEPRPSTKWNVNWTQYISFTLMCNPQGILFFLI